MNKFHLLLWIVFVVLAQTSLDHPTTVGVAMVIVPILFSMIIFLFSKNIFIYNDLKIHVVFFFFALFSIINIFISGEIKISLIVLILRMATIYIFISLIVTSYYKGDGIKYLIFATYISFSVIILFSFLQPNYYQGAFSGIYKNPNTLGLVMIEFVLLNLIHIYSLLEKKSRRIDLIIPFIFLGISLYVTLMTESRTAFLVIIIMIISFLGILFIKFIIEGYLKRILILFSFLSLSSIAIIFLVIKNETLNNLYNNILSQFTQRSTGFTSGRSNLWNHAINDFKITGHGIYLFEQTYGNPPHNVYLTIMNDFGLIPFLLFLIYFIMIVYLLIKNIKLYSLDIINVFCLMIIIAFLGVSMVESIRLHYLFYLLFMAGGILSLKIPRTELQTKEVRNERN